QVIVKENQWAVFFRDGKAYDVFGPGRHTITSKNIPLITGALKGLGIIGDIFNCEVIFVTNSQFRGNFGGQAYSAPSGSIGYQAELGFYGYLLYKVEDPKLFVVEFFGNRGATTSGDVERYIRGFINERVIDEFANFDISNLVKNIDETTDKVSLIISDEAARIGLKVIDTVFEGVKIPEEARRFATGMGQKAMTMQYMKETAAELPEAGGGAAGAGVGAGVGLAMGTTLARQMQTETGEKLLMCQSCGATNPVGARFCGNCGASLAPVPKVKCPNCGAEVPSNMKFCGNCGARLKPEEKDCPKCGAKNPTGNKFCGECGAKLQ
ncbi:zinc-ribbon domain-containing protein, partial [Candidatus Bathyarchaeota archaeon]|nr:SPFH domain-containing protein [Candidatus Bathyarchaeota archaeon]NIR15364.1 SPFH domain-containing protein [Desulfobacterales bacterium]NIU81832.1 zinc-ribbon domain-containing protein [Candidatus Bathyarchaeota archaeon]NIV68484.1 zinc-ribbon domain-containing protein [Candidatus Bathyarchaeota archaeon]NIW16763.1 zinc-ribbon domain-containing protein [Candidatus Bathyarchaeota archaeon]